MLRMMASGVKHTHGNAAIRSMNAGAHVLWTVVDLNSGDGRYGFLADEESLRKRQVLEDVLAPVHREHENEREQARRHVVDSHANPDAT